jgi:hypothetical protein
MTIIHNIHQPLYRQREEETFKEKLAVEILLRITSCPHFSHPAPMAEFF